MGTILQRDSVVKNVLKNLCCSYGWSYGAFWSHAQPNSILLTLQDAYFEEKLGSLIDNLLLEVPVGVGIIGQVAYTNKHKWMSSEDNYREQSLSGSIWDMFLDDYEFHSQFSSGMKTIAVIPVEPQGVVQFGSSGKIPERMDFVNQAKRMFQEIVNDGGSDISLTFLNGQNCLRSEAFASLISSKELCFTSGDGNSSKSNPSSFLSDELPNFGIPNEFCQAGDFYDSQWFPPLDPINYDGKHESLTISGSDVDLRGNNNDLRDILAPIISQNRSGLHSYSHLDHTALNPKGNLFSKLGIEELLDGVSSISNVGSSSCIEGQVSVKRRKTGNSMWDASQPILDMVDGYSMSGSSTVLQGKKQVEPPRPTKKKAKPGTRPRPKDRQQILDRMAELRQLIPNGEKVSIDCLLDRTIKHMLFLQSVTKQAENIKQAEKQKHNGVVSNYSSTNGVTWACEIGNQMMVCPLMVEDLNEHGQMFIEMLCEEEGFFLEIMDIIRHFGLIILKGVMETRGGYIWAHFIVEPEVNRVVTRHEIFTGLVQFIQTVSTINKRCTSSANSPLDFHQDGIQDLVNLADMQFCVNL